MAVRLENPNRPSRPDGGGGQPSLVGQGAVGAAPLAARWERLHRLPGAAPHGRRAGATGPGPGGGGCDPGGRGLSRGGERGPWPRWLERGPPRGTLRARRPGPVSPCAGAAARRGRVTRCTHGRGPGGTRAAWAWLGRGTSMAPPTASDGHGADAAAPAALLWLLQRGRADLSRARLGARPNNVGAIPVRGCAASRRASQRAGAPARREHRRLVNASIRTS